MRITIITLLNILLFTCLYAQRDPVVGITNWSRDYALTWDDFKGDVPIDTIPPYNLDVRLGYNFMNHDGGIIFNAIKNQAYLLNRTSYVHEQYKSDELLYFLQTYFDLAGLYSREYQNRLIRDQRGLQKISPNVSIIQDVVQSEWTNDINNYLKETEYGTVTERILAWDQYIQQRLDTMSTPTFKTDPWGIGLSLDVGFLQGIAGSREYVRPRGPSIFLEMYILKRPWSFSLGLHDNYVNTQQTFGTDGFFGRDREISMMHVYLIPGYDIVENNVWKILVQGGPTLVSLRYLQNSEFEGSESKFGWLAGITADYKIKSKEAREDPLRMLSYFGVRGRVMYNQVSSEGAGAIRHLVFTLGVSMTIGGGRYLLK